ncbi:MAG: hypothetical protein KAI29_06190, partial [Cyclobacteriaceae bacterium]|nr:hypothetical protein [Cyclobacteriaceae bacterium]
MKHLNQIVSIFIILILFSCDQDAEKTNRSAQPIYQDIPYLQDYAVKYFFEEDSVELKKVFTDRNDVIEVLTSKGIYRPNNGHFQYPGTLEPERNYVPMADKKITDIIIHQNQFVYVDDQAVLSNAWAGKLFSIHNLPDANIVCNSNDFTFMLSNGKSLSLVKDSKSLWQGELPDDRVLSIKSKKDNFLILGESSLYTFTSQSGKLEKVFSGSGFTCFEIVDEGNKILIGTNDGYIEIDETGKQLGEITNKLPWPELTDIKEINGQLWFGSTKGAFMLKDDGKFNYY